MTATTTVFGVSACLLSACLLSACGGDSASGSLGVNGHIANCPQVADVTVLPLDVELGGEITVSAAVGEHAPRTTWSASAGRFEDAQAPNTIYHCEIAGEQRLLFTIDADPECRNRIAFRVRCGLPNAEQP